MKRPLTLAEAKDMIDRLQARLLSMEHAMAVALENNDLEAHFAIQRQRYRLLIQQSRIQKIVEASDNH